MPQTRSQSSSPRHRPPVPPVVEGNGALLRQVISKPGRTAFTLIELVLVMAIIAICAMIAAPHLADSINARKLPNDATDFVTVTRWCRVQALQDGVLYRLNLDPDNNRWWVTKDDGSGTNFTQVTAATGLEYKMVDGVSMQSGIPAVDGEMYIGFDPGGRTDTGAVAFVYQGVSLVVKCDSPMGSYHIVTKGNGTP